MACKVILERDYYYPGQTVNGRVECTFDSETKVSGIRIRFKGKAKVEWKEGRYSLYTEKEKYFDMESELLACETTFQPGHYQYAFNYNLPGLLPSTVSGQCGYVAYVAAVTVDRPWAIDYTDSKEFEIKSHIDLNTVCSVTRAMEYRRKRYPYSFFGESGPIILVVRLACTGYVPLQMVNFVAEIKNESRIDVKDIQFRLIQGFKYYTESRSKVADAVKTQRFSVVNGSVPAGSTNSWNLEIRVPENMFNGSLVSCKIMKSYVELRAEVILPMMWKSLKMEVPLLLGTVPIVPPSEDQAKSVST